MLSLELAPLSHMQPDSQTKKPGRAVVQHVHMALVPDNEVGPPSGGHGAARKFSFSGPRPVPIGGGQVEGLGDVGEDVQLSSGPL